MSFVKLRGSARTIFGGTPPDLNERSGKANDRWRGKGDIIIG